MAAQRWHQAGSHMRSSRLLAASVNCLDTKAVRGGLLSESQSRFAELRAGARKARLTGTEPGSHAVLQPRESSWDCLKSKSGDPG